MIDSELLTSFQKKIVHIMANQLEMGKVTEADLSEIAEYVLAQTDEIDSYDHLVLFLKNLSNKWPIFHDLYILEEEKLKNAGEEQKVVKALELMKEGRIDEAIQETKV